MTAVRHFIRDDPEIGFNAWPSVKSVTDDSTEAARVIAAAVAAGRRAVLPDVGTPWILDNITSSVDLEIRGGFKWKGTASANPCLTMTAGASLTVHGIINGNAANNAARQAAETPMISVDGSAHGDPGGVIDLSKAIATGVPSALVKTDEFAAGGTIHAPWLSYDCPGKGQFFAICCKDWTLYSPKTRNVCYADGWQIRVGHYVSQNRTELITGVKIYDVNLTGNTNGDSTSGSGILCEIDAQNVQVHGCKLDKLYQHLKVESDATIDGLDVWGLESTNIYAVVLGFNLKGTGARIHSGKVTGQGIAELGDYAIWKADWTGGGPTGGTEPVIKCRGTRPRVECLITSPLQDGVKTESGATCADIRVTVDACTTDCVDLAATQATVWLKVIGTPTAGIRIRSTATSPTIDPDSFFDSAVTGVDSALTDGSCHFQPTGSLVRTVDANTTLTATANPEFVDLAGTLTATRTLTVNLTGTGKGKGFIINRSGGSSGGPFSWLVKEQTTLTLLATLAQGDACHVKRLDTTIVALRKWTPPA